MHVLFLITGMVFAEPNTERDLRIAESATVIGGAFAIVSTVSYRRAKKIEDQMLRESNNYNYNELLQSYKGHRNQYIVAVPATIVFSGLAVGLYTRRNIQKSNFFTSPPQPKSNFTDTSSTVEFDSVNATNQEEFIQREHIEKKSSQRYKKILNFLQKEEFSQELQNESKVIEPVPNEPNSLEKLGQDEGGVPDDESTSQEQPKTDQQEK